MSATERLRALADHHRGAARLARLAGRDDWRKDHMRLCHRALARLRALKKGDPR